MESSSMNPEYTVYSVSHRQKPRAVYILLQLL